MDKQNSKTSDETSKDETSVDGNESYDEQIILKDSVELDETKRIVLMPVDFSENSERAFNWYCKEFHREKDILFLVHIIESVGNKISYDSTSKIGVHTNEFNQIIQDQINEGKKIGRKFLENCKNESIKAKFTVHMGGKPGEHIVKLTKDHNISIIVIGNRNLSNLKRTILGSVSEYVMHHVTCPVVVVPPKGKHMSQSSEKSSSDKEKKIKLPNILKKKKSEPT